VVGTTGESPTVDFDEHRLLIKTAVDHTARRVPVIAGTGANSTSEAIELAAYAREAGADLSLSVVPYYNKPTQEGLYRHFKAIAEAVDLPIVLYNVPGRTSVNMLPPTVARLSSFKNIVAIKEGSGSLQQVSDVIQACGERLTVLSGDDALTHHRSPQTGPIRTEDAIAVAVCAAAEMLSAPLIVCFTSSGFTARKVATCRPTVPVFACTPEPETFRQLALVWGVTPALTEHSTNYDTMLAVARQQILDRQLAQPGERLVVTAGVPFDMPGTTNLLKVEAV